MKQPTLKEVKKVLLEQGMKVFTKPYDMTLFLIRTKDNKSEEFNDFVGMLYHNHQGDLLGIIRNGTSDAGLYYRLNPINLKDTAIIQHGRQYMGAFTYMKKGGHKGQEAFRQTGKIWYWMDVNRDIYLDFDGEQQFAIRNTNGHDMGTVGKKVGKNSAGCWGAINSVMDELYALAQLQIKHGHGDKFSLAVLHENDFICEVCGK